MMTDRTAKAVATEWEADTTCLLYWVFQLGEHVLTCAVDVRDDHTYEVCVIPHGDVSASAMERFKTAVSAFKRHAEVASALRLAGWVLRSYGRQLGS